MSRNGQKKVGYLTDKKYREIIENPDSLLHFVGIGGVSMYSLASLALNFGVAVSGSDRVKSERTERLIELGARIFYEHSAENVTSASLVIYTHAVGDDNPELLRACELGIPILSRAELMGIMMRSYSHRIGVSGSHGKSTVTAMLECIFSRAGVDPTVLSGADLPSGEPFKIGADEYMLYEACEYKDSFLHFSPTVTVGLNLELDHTDYFSDISALKKSFAKALGRATCFSMICYDDANLRSIIPKIKSPVLTYGADERADYRYSITSFGRGRYEFSLSKHADFIGVFRLNIPGVFNISNAACAIAIALEFGIDKDLIGDAIASYRGIARRLEYVGTRWGRAVYYDYAHHPTEISSSINALRELLYGPITLVFKPHTFSRTKALWQSFCNALSLSDYIIITDIFPAREEPIFGVSSQRLAGEIKGAIYCKDEDVPGVIDGMTRGAILLMGAGDLEKVKNDVLN